MIYLLVVFVLVLLLLIARELTVMSCDMRTAGRTPDSFMEHVLEEVVGSRCCHYYTILYCIVCLYYSVYYTIPHYTILYTILPWAGEAFAPKRGDLLDPITSHETVRST